MSRLVLMSIGCVLAGIAFSLTQLSDQMLALRETTEAFIVVGGVTGHVYACRCMTRRRQWVDGTNIGTVR